MILFLDDTNMPKMGDTIICHSSTTNEKFEGYVLMDPKPNKEDIMSTIVELLPNGDRVTVNYNEWSGIWIME